MAGKRFIGHTLVVGITGTGKTTLVRKLAAELSRNKPVLVLTPCIDDDWSFASLVSSDLEFFSQVVFANKNCIVIVDEGAEMAGQFDKLAVPLASRTRHNGHICFFLAQRPTMINKSIRGNCRNLFCFQVSKDETIELNRLFVNDVVFEAPSLREGEYIAIVDRKTMRGKVF